MWTWLKKLQACVPALSLRSRVVPAPEEFKLNLAVTLRRLTKECPGAGAWDVLGGLCVAASERGETLSLVRRKACCQDTGSTAVDYLLQETHGPLIDEELVNQRLRQALHEWGSPAKNVVFEDRAFLWDLPSCPAALSPSYITARAARKCIEQDYQVYWLQQHTAPARAHRQAYQMDQTTSAAPPPAHPPAARRRL